MRALFGGARRLSCIRIRWLFEENATEIKMDEQWIKRGGQAIFASPWNSFLIQQSVAFCCSLFLKFLCYFFVHCTRIISGWRVGRRKKKEKKFTWFDFEYVTVLFLIYFFSAFVRSSLFGALYLTVYIIIMVIILLFSFKHISHFISSLSSSSFFVQQSNRCCYYTRIKVICGQQMRVG